MHAEAASVFSRRFGAALTLRGFIPANSLNTVYAKMTGSETVGMIAILPHHDMLPTVYCGIATLYCRNLDPAYWQDQIPFWMNTLDFFYHTHYPDTWTPETMDALSGRGCEDPVRTAGQAIQWTEQLVLPLIEKVNDLSSAVDFLIRYGRSVTECISSESPLAEDLLCIRAGYQGDFLETLETRREYTQHRRSDNERGMTSDDTDYADYAKQKKEAASLLKQMLLTVVGDPEQMQAALAECEKRRRQNRAYLREAGILTDIRP